MFISLNLPRQNCSCLFQRGGSELAEYWLLKTAQEISRNRFHGSNVLTLFKGVKEQVGWKLKGWWFQKEFLWRGLSCVLSHSGEGWVWLPFGSNLLATFDGTIQWQVSDPHSGKGNLSGKPIMVIAGEARCSSVWSSGEHGAGGTWVAFWECVLQKHVSVVCSVDLTNERSGMFWVGLCL